MGSGQTTAAVSTSDGFIPASEGDGGSLSSCVGTCEVSGGSFDLSFQPQDPHSPQDPYKCYRLLIGAGTITWSDATTSSFSVNAKVPPNPVRNFKATGTVSSGRFAGQSIAIAFSRSVATNLCVNTNYTETGIAAIG